MVPLVLAVLLLLPGTIQNVLQAYLMVYFNSQATRFTVIFLIIILI